jgi:predicted ArsR family transcriptional regulator
VALGMAQVSVRHHLDVLVGADLVVLTGVRRHDGAGRPSQMYALTPQAARLFPQRHDALAAQLLSELRVTLPPGELSALLARMADETAREAPAAPPEQAIEVRLDDVANFLTEKGYAARWEACDGHYELHACNCPYAGVSESHPELCMMDQVMMQQLLPGAVRLQSQAIDGATRCTYVLDLQPVRSNQE